MFIFSKMNFCLLANRVRYRLSVGKYCEASVTQKYQKLFILDLVTRAVLLFAMYTYWLPFLAFTVLTVAAVIPRHSSSIDHFNTTAAQLCRHLNCHSTENEPVDGPSAADNELFTDKKFFYILVLELFNFVFYFGILKYVLVVIKIDCKTSLK